MKQKIDQKPEEKEGCLINVLQHVCGIDGFIDSLTWLLLIGAPVVFFTGLVMTSCEQNDSQKTIKVVPAEQRQPMIEIPVERTVCVKPAEGYCMEYRTSRIRTP